MNPSLDTTLYIARDLARGLAIMNGNPLMTPLSTTELRFFDGTKIRFGHHPLYGWSCTAETVAHHCECDESDVDLLEADSDEGRDEDQVTVNGVPVAVFGPKKEVEE